MAKTKSRTPGQEAPIPGCLPDLLEYYEETLDKRLELLVDAAIGIPQHPIQNSLVKLISAIQQGAVSQEGQLKVYAALRQDYECASKLPGSEEALGEIDSGEPFNQFLIASILPWDTDMYEYVGAESGSHKLVTRQTCISSWLDLSQCILRPADLSKTNAL